jgi:hypothetical protein
MKPRALRLEDVLRQLPERELGSIIERLRINVDGSKRIDIASQVARALLNLPEVRDPGILPTPTRELFYRIAEARGCLVVERLPPPVDPLVLRGIVFVREGEGGNVELLLPIAFMLLTRAWEGEDPRGIRALLAQLNPDVAMSIASHYLGRPGTPPVALSLEAAWEALNDPERLQREVEALAPLERKLLRSVEEVGGEVDTEELLDLEREPMRLRGATGATPSRRGVGFALERRGFLIPVHPNRHVIPAEVAAVVGAQRRAEREAQRRQILSFVLGTDHAPTRARFSEDPVPLALAMMLAVRDPSVEIRPGVGTPRSLLAKFAARFGRSPETVNIIAALSRAIGLWDPAVAAASAPPGSLRVHELGRSLFDAWRRGGAWDEARPDGEVLRVAAESRETSPIGVIREIVIEALADLGTGRWAPWEAVAAYVRADDRTPGVARLIERWSARAGIEATTPADIARRIALETLHVLGIVDLGDPESEGELGPILRITPRGRAYLDGSPQPTQPEPSRFLDHQLLRVGSETRVGHLAAIAPFVEIGAVAAQLDASLTQQSISLALSAGYDTDAMRSRLEAVAPLPDPISRLLVQASAVVGRAEFVRTEGFLWVEDSEIRELLRSRRQTADLFVDPSPPAGLLIAPGVDLDRLARRCRGLGVEVIVEGEVYKTRSMMPPPRGGSGARRLSAPDLAPATTRATSASSMRPLSTTPASRAPAATSSSSIAAVRPPSQAPKPRARRSSIPPAKR